jgi:hypothetical protein
MNLRAHAHLVTLLILAGAANAVAQPYYVRGDFNGWANNTDPMIGIAGGQWIYSATGLMSATSYEFKATVDDWSFSAPTTNAKAPANGAGVIQVHFFPNASWVDGWMPDTKPRLGWVDPQTFDWEIAGDMNGWSGGPAWFLADTGNGLHVGQFVMTAGAYQFKFRERGSWNHSVGDDTGISAANNQITVAATGDQWRFELDLPNGRWRASRVGAVRYVSSSAPPFGDGLTWATAFDSLEAALNVATPDWEIRVGAGTYVAPAPTGFLVQNTLDGIRLRGGYAGTGASNPEERNPREHRTVLNKGISADRIMLIAAVNSTTVIDGFEFRGASNQNTDGAALRIEGGGFEGPTVTDCVFVGNTSESGGAVAVFDAGAVFANCLFVNNLADKLNDGIRAWGGAIYSSNADITVANCTYQGNFAEQHGAAIAHGDGGSLQIHNSILWANAPQPSAVLLFDNARQLGAPLGVTVAYSDIEGGVDGFEVLGPNPASFDFQATNLEVEPRLTPSGHLRQDSPCIGAGSASLLPADTADLDQDGNTSETIPVDADLETRMGPVDIGADHFVDLDADGLPNWWEDLYFGSPTAAVSTADPDGEGQTNIVEYEYYGSNPMAAPLDASPGSGNLQAQVTAASSGDSVRTMGPGVYDDNLAFNRKTVVVLPAPGAPGLREIDCATNPALMYEALGSPMLQQFNMTNAGTGGVLDAQFNRALLRNCNLLDCQTSISAHSGAPRLRNVDLGPHSAGSPGGSEFFHSSVEIVQSLQIDEPFRVCASDFFGSGYLWLQPGSELLIDSPTGLPCDDPTLIQTHILGAGDIRIPFGRQLRILDGSVVDLSGLTTGANVPDVSTACDEPINPCDAPDPLCADPNLVGSIFIEGELVVQDSLIQNCNIEVVLGDVDGSAIVNNDISLLETSGFGGELFVTGNSVIRCNRITSEGDRYLDLDPDPDAADRPCVIHNSFHVKITQGAELDQGELIELRSEDVDPAVGGGFSGAHMLPMSDGYCDAWAFDTLEVIGKGNLTNRQGFEFQDANAPYPEALYVERLIMHPGAVLNTGLQRMYYQSLEDPNGNMLAPPDPNDPEGVLSNGARIVDIPVLGFSLVVINMEDQTEYDLRVRTRLNDPNEDQGDLSALLEGTIARVADPADPGDPNDPGANHVMVMSTNTGGGDSVRSVAAHGSFARAGDEDITVKFEYRFESVSTDPNRPTELLVYLTDSPDVSANLLEVARVVPPASGEPGGVGSGQFKTFFATYPRRDLNFRRGTYVELELRGHGSVVLIDDWDPTVTCTSATCSDLDETNTLDEIDFLIEVGSLGQSLSAYCPDDALSNDEYVDIQDVLNFDTKLNGTGLNACASGLGYEVRGGRSGNPVNVPVGADLLIAGKPSDPNGAQQDFLFATDPNGGCIGDALPPASEPDSTSGYRSNGRLAQSADGKLYQLHATQGLIQLDSAEVVIAPGIATGPSGETIYVGPNRVAGDPNFLGAPISDVEFHPIDPAVVYVVPVVVAPSDLDPNNYDPYSTDAAAARYYRAAAKLTLTGAGSYTVDELYGLDPRDDSTVTTAPPQSPVQSLREIEVDALGNVYVLSANKTNDNDWLLIYDEADGSSETRISLAADLDAPTALLVSQTDPNTLYVAESLSGVAGQSRVLRYGITRSAGAATGLSSPGEIIIDAGAIDLSGVASSCADANEPVSLIAALAEAPDGAVYALGLVMPKLQSISCLYGASALFSVPTLTHITPGATGTLPAGAIGCNSLSLPLSLLHIGELAVGCGPACEVPGGDADVTGDCAVNISDLGTVLGNFGSSSASHADGDTNGDGAVNITDLGNVLSLFGTSCP